VCLPLPFSPSPPVLAPLSRSLLSSAGGISHLSLPFPLLHFMPSSSSSSSALLPRRPSL
jgi:hypothetical protein